MKKLLLILVSFVTIGVYAQATYNMPSGTNTASYTTCNAIFYDMGGLSGNHGLNQNSSIKFTPSSPGLAIKIVFTSFVVAEGATMIIYDGPDNTYVPIATFDEFILPTGLPMVASPSPLNPDGPVGPVGPVIPVVPAIPWGPVGPVGPVAPVSPLGIVKFKIAF